MPHIGPFVGVGRRQRNNALPSLPLATGAKVMLHGHSFVANGGFTASADGVTLPLVQIASRTYGELSWLRGYGARFNLDAWPDVNVPNKGLYGLANLINGASQGTGATLTNALTEVAYLIARKPDIVCLTFGINDVIGGRSLAAMQADYTSLLDAYRRAGIWVVADTIAPVTSSVIPDGNSKLAVLSDFNAWLKAQEAVRTGLKVFDVETVFGSGRPSQSYWLQTDGLHPQDRGAHALAVARLVVLDTMVNSGAYIDRDPGVSNKMPNATYAGTSGTKGTGVTGSVASNFDVSRVAGTSTIVCAKEASDVAGYDKQVFTITPVNDGTLVHKLTMKQTSNVTLASIGLAVGDWLQALQYVEMSSWDYWVRATWNILLAQGTTTKWTTTIARSGLNTGAYILPTGGYGMWMLSDAFQIPSDMSIDTLRLTGFNTGSMLELQWLSTASGSGVCKISKPILRKVTDPRTAWIL